MGKKIQLSEAALTKIIKESVMAEIDRRAVMPGKYYEIFKNRIINAQHGSFGDVDRTIMEFFKDFKDRIPNEGFTPENLKDLAEKIEGGGTTHERGDMPGGHKIKDADGWWGRNAGKFLEEKKVKVTEGQLRKLIKESVMKAIMNEISSDMIGRARDKFSSKYGMDGSERDNLEKDKYGNPIHPKDKKPIANHMRNFNNAYNNAKRDEALNDPMVAKAQELYDGGIDWEQEIDDRDGGGAFGSIYGEVEDENGGTWRFYGDASFEWEGSWEISEIDEVDFVAPDGTTGSVPRP